MEILPELRLKIHDVQITLRQIQVLFTIANTNSQNQAAKALGIAVPVLHRHVRELEQKLGVELVHSTPRGTALTEYGKEILETYKTYENKLKSYQKPVVACSPLFTHLVQKAVSDLERAGYEIDILIGNDELNNFCLDTGLAGLVVFDDPIYIYRERKRGEKQEIAEIVKDTLYHAFRGEKYLKFRYGAQRIGYANLDLQDADYEVVGETSDWQKLIESPHSFFLNRSLIKREELDMESQTKPDLLMHSIFAVRVSDGEEYLALLQRLSQKEK
jgi:molybdate transport repressor ModE-like protein